MEELEPVTHLEKYIAGEVQPTTHLEKVIEQYGGGGSGGGGAVSSVNGKTGAVTLNAEDVGAAQDALRLTATPTSDLSGNILISGTWSGATWEEVMQAVQASRLIQLDVEGIFQFTLLYNRNLFVTSEVDSVCFEFRFETTAVAKARLIENGNFSIDVVALSDPNVNQIAGSDVIITPFANTVYNCGELTSLTISNPPATGKYTIIFFSGATATATVGIENFVAEANKRYKITVEDNYATYDSWPYTPT